MNTIEENKQLHMQNVLSLRKKMTQKDMQNEMIKIGQVLEECNVKKNGYIVTTVFGMEGALIDIEILVPLEKETQLPEPYKLKKKFQLNNAIYSRFEGNPTQLNNHLQTMMTYITQNGEQAITGAYNVQISEDGNADNMIIDSYIGVSGNKL